MPRISPADFVGTRVRFQRIADARLFHGWLDDFRGNVLSIHTTADLSADLGSPFAFEAFGQGVTAAFDASLALVASQPARISSELGSNLAFCMEPGWTTLHFKIVGTMRCVTSEESFRIRTNDLRVSIVIDDIDETMRVLDVGAKGFGAVSERPWEPGSLVGFAFDTRLGRVIGQGEVRYCRETPLPDGPYRIGVLLKRLPRLDGPRWERFVRELS